MNLKEFEEWLNKIGILPIQGTEEEKVRIKQQRLRVAFFKNHIENLYNFLHNKDQNCQIPNYTFFQCALKDPELLTDYAKIFDDFTVAGINCELKKYKITKITNGMNDRSSHEIYESFFKEKVFGKRYTEYIYKFYDEYPVVWRAVKRIERNIESNICEFCQNINKDISSIKNIFGSKNYTIEKLKKIQSTGSDFHKGGKQVVIMTFSEVAIMSDQSASSVKIKRDLKIVYKPSDVEVDCLIAGDSNAVNYVHEGFQKNSLFEIFNALSEKYPESSVEKLPTYKIIPMDYGSSLREIDSKVEIRKSYGYIEFLRHKNISLPLPTIIYKILGDSVYVCGASDYKIFPCQDIDKICKKFYKQIGHLLALAGIFSFTDIHIENLIVSKYQPHLIDLEVALYRRVLKVSATCMLGDGDKSSITGSTTKIYDFLVYQYDGDNYIQVRREHIKDEPEQNRLYNAIGNNLIGPEVEPILLGIKGSFHLLKKSFKSTLWEEWFKRLNNVIVRYIPYKTEDFQTLINKIYKEQEELKDLWYYKKAVDLFLESDYKTNKKHEPNYLIYNDPQTELDLLKCDIPSYYHRIGSLNILNSSGNIVPVPPNIDIWDDNQKKYINKPTDLERDTFFVESPMDKNVHQAQFNVVFSPQKTTTYNERLYEFITQTKNYLGNSKNNVQSNLNLISPN